jgi:short-subunit dehydrogenase
LPFEEGESTTTDFCSVYQPEKNVMQKAIIIGATTGMGRELAHVLMANNYKVGITGLEKELLEEMEQAHPEHFVAHHYNCTTDSNAVEIQKLIDRLGGLDLLVLSAGIGGLNKDLGYEVENRANKLNVLAFTEIADWSYRFFEKQGHGQFVSLTSLAGLFGYRVAPAYHAAKAYQINYLEALRQKANKSGLPIYITDIRPGFVDTAMTEDKKGFWRCSVEKASRQIYSSIRRKKNIGYISRRWVIVATIVRLLPRFLRNRL